MSLAISVRLEEGNTSTVSPCTALDYSRDFFGIPGQNPTDLASASAAALKQRRTEAWLSYL